MLARIDIHHDNQQTILLEAQTRIDAEMQKMGFEQIRKPLLASKLCLMFYQLRDPEAGVFPALLTHAIDSLNNAPNLYKIECRLMADSSMP